MKLSRIHHVAYRCKDAKEKGNGFNLVGYFCLRYNFQYVSLDAYSSSRKQKHGYFH